MYLIILSFTFTDVLLFNITLFDFNIGGQLVKKTIKDLSVTFVLKFSFSDHIVSIYKFAFAIIFIFRRLDNTRYQTIVLLISQI